MASSSSDAGYTTWLKSEDLQNLLTQMYGWNAPGTKYDVATIAEWLEGENDLVRHRITELIHRRKD